MSSVYRMPVDPAATNNPHSYAISLVGSGHRVLEVGCSVGHVTEHLVAAGNSVVGVEIDPSAAIEAERWAERVHVVDLDLTELSQIETDHFDVIVAGDVLEHLRDPARVLADLTTLLTDDGRLVVSIPNIAHVDARLMLFDGAWTYQDTGLLDRTHLRFFTRESFRQLLADAGFVATRVERVRIDPFTSGLPLDRDAVPQALVDVIMNDPEAHTFQFVVEARRTGDDRLADVEPTAAPSLVGAAEAAELRERLADAEEHNAALQNEVDAWRSSRLVRLTDPIRNLRRRLSRSATSP